MPQFAARACLESPRLRLFFVKRLPARFCRAVRWLKRRRPACATRGRENSFAQKQISLPP